MNETQPSVEIPKGEPNTLRFAARRYSSIDQALSGGEIQLQQAPLTVSSWEGTASIRYAAVAADHAAAVRSHRGSIQAARDATEEYADRLEQAREEAREAKRSEKEALDHIADLKDKIADEREIQRTATAAIVQAQMDLVGDLAGTDTGAQDRLAAAQETLRESNEREARLRDKLTDEREALTRARRKGDRATEKARLAAVGYASGMEAAAGVPPVIAALGPAMRSLGGGQRTHLRRPQEIKTKVDEPLPAGNGAGSGMTPIAALGWAITGGTGGYMNNLEMARRTRRAANRMLSHASDAGHKLTYTGYRNGLAEAEAATAKASSGARLAAKGARFAKPLGPLTDLGTGAYEAASGQKGWVRAGMETAGGIGGGVIGGGLAGLLGIESGPGAFVTGAAGAVGGSAAGKGLAGEIADILGIH